MIVRMVAPWPGWGSGRMVVCDAVPQVGATVHAGGASFRVEAVHHRLSAECAAVSEIALIMRPLGNAQQRAAAEELAGA